MTPAGSIPVSAQALELLAVQARRNGTQSAFIDIALQWALQASQEIDRLTRERDELVDEVALKVACINGMSNAADKLAAERDEARTEREALRAALTELAAKDEK